MKASYIKKINLYIQKHEKLIQSISVGTLIFIGILIRLRLFIFNRSLWLDEASLSVNIVENNWLALLDYSKYWNLQVAPLGFIYICKIFVAIFGVNEYALRLFPLVAGCISIVFFIF
jgi:hypothetical protein